MRTLSLLCVDVVDAGSSIRLLAVVVVAFVVAADGNTVGSGYRCPRLIHRVGEGRCSRLVFGIWTVGNVMPCLTAVETGPSIVVVGGDLDYIALRGLHGVLAPELCVRGLWAYHLRLGPILHWGLRSWCSVAEASWFLKAVLLAGLAFQKLALVILPFFSFGPFCKNDLFIRV